MENKDRASLDKLSSPHFKKAQEDIDRMFSGLPIQGATERYAESRRRMGIGNNAPTTLTGEANGFTWTYTGDVHNGLRHGKGKCKSSNGGVYEGDWVDNKRHGKGKFTFTDGSVYEGDWIEGKMYGKGKMTYPNGDVYEGDFVDNKRHGKGKFTTSNGEVYKGDWVDDKQASKGTNRGTGKGKKTYTEDSAEKVEDKMGFIYCPNCGQSVSVQAKLSACPKCYHPFDAKEWQKIKAQKDARAAEEKRIRDARAAEERREREEEEQRLKSAERHNECPLCHQTISWEKTGYSSYGLGGIDCYHSFRRPYCQSCSWKSSLAFENYDGANKDSIITNWEVAVEKCKKYGR